MLTKVYNVEMLDYNLTCSQPSQSAPMTSTPTFVQTNISRVFPTLGTLSSPIEYFIHPAAVEGLPEACTPDMDVVGQLQIPQIFIQIIVVFTPIGPCPLIVCHPVWLVFLVSSYGSCTGSTSLTPNCSLLIHYSGSGVKRVGKDEHTEQHLQLC